MRLPRITRRSLALGAIAALIVEFLPSDVAAQAKKEAPKYRIIGYQGSNDIKITVLSVLAAPAEEHRVEGGRVLVPIRIAWKTDPWGNRELLELKVRLDIVDDTGAIVELTKDLGVRDKQDTLILTVDEGRVLERYELTIVGQCRFKDENGKVRVEPTTADLAGNF